jgi:hypothetical protein
MAQEKTHVGLLMAPKEARQGKPLTFFCKKKSCKDIFGTKSTLAGLFFAKNSATLFLPFPSCSSS